MRAKSSVLEWLLDSDPAIRWQVMRDLAKEPEELVAAERSRVASEGWGARLLDLQAPEGHWGRDAEEGDLLCTAFTLILLRDLGLDPKGERARIAIGRVRDHLAWTKFDGQPFFDGETEPCINGRILAAGAYFGAASDRLVDRLLDEQLEDGGWNCDAPQSRRSSFHSTICVLEGLLEYEKAEGASAAVTDARVRGQEYLLERRMLRSLSSGEVIDRKWTRFWFPTTFHYDVLRGLDYLRSAGVEPDERMAEAVGLVRKRRHQNGLWPLRKPADRRLTLWADRVPFDMEETGKASRWNTLRALRVLDWQSARN
ncbi:hypothetical protein [Cohnella zeiphila]|uniref:Squalene cyclase C-terminal domain-containing protein n=1 Tax=Cohnella zeiphila TaxID=2761120 RepID=A0A7X0SR11_9BACL|nr:hypothetical protein [Cohnella zeiphila]MBB6733335.1 hypothetical protein [Cohnella zeiphila]